MEAIDTCPIKYEAESGGAPPRDPTRASKTYTAPIVVSSTTTFKVALACDGQSDKGWLVSTLTFTKE